MTLQDLLNKAKGFLNAPAPQWMQNTLGQVPQAPQFTQQIPQKIIQFESKLPVQQAIQQKSFQPIVNAFNGGGFKFGLSGDQAAEQGNRLIQAALPFQPGELKTSAVNSLEGIGQEIQNIMKDIPNVGKQISGAPVIDSLPARNVVVNNANQAERQAGQTIGHSIQLPAQTIDRTPTQMYEPKSILFKNKGKLGLSIKDVSGGKASKAYVKRLFNGEYVKTNDGYGNQFFQVKGELPNEYLSHGIKEKPLGNAKVNITDVAGKADTPINIAEQGIWNGTKLKALRFDDGSVVQKHFVDEILSKYPDAKPFVESGYKNSPIAFKVGDEVVGAIRPVADGIIDNPVKVSSKIETPKKFSASDVLNKQINKTDNIDFLNKKYTGKTIRPDAYQASRQKGIRKTVGEIINQDKSPLIQEARKYKSADELIKDKYNFASKLKGESPNTPKSQRELSNKVYAEMQNNGFKNYTELWNKANNIKVNKVDATNEVVFVNGKPKFKSELSQPPQEGNTLIQEARKATDDFGVAKHPEVKKEADKLIDELISESGKGKVKLYHGTDSETAKQIYKSGYFESGKNQPSFFTTSKKEAEEYARNKTKYRGKGTPEVIEVDAPKYAVSKNSGTGEIETHTGAKLYFRGKDAFVKDTELLESFDRFPKSKHLQEAKPTSQADAFMAENGRKRIGEQKKLAMPEGYAVGDGFQMSPGKDRSTIQGLFNNPQQKINTIRVKDKNGVAKPIKVSSTYVAKPGQEPQVMGATRKFFTGGDTVLKRSGKGGQRLEQAMQEQRKSEDLLRGRWNNHINQATDGLNKEQLANVDAVLRGEAKPMDAKTAGASKSLRNWFNSIGKTAEDMKFEITNSKGDKTPFKMREDYAPQIYNFTALEKGAQRERALQHLVDSKQARNLGEATQMLDGFIKKNTERKVGNLEKAREINLPDFERDPKVYAKIYASNIARRFTEAEKFGKKDEIVASYINQIAQEGGDYMAAQKIFDYNAKGAPQNKVVNAITQYNLATQLDLSAITNASQSINTMTDAGILNTLKGAYKGFTKEGKKIAEGAGVYDGFIHVKETGVDLNKIVKGVLWPFQQVENFNRRTASNAAVFRAKELVARHTKEATAFTTRKLAELGIDPSKLKNGKLSSEDMMSAAYELARGTQFKVDTLDVPTAWKTPAGKMVTQFQSFSFMQTKFIRDKVIGEARKGNWAPLARFIPLAIGASFLAQKGRNLVTGRSEADQATSTDVRAWDKYLKAFGDFASSKIIQGEFLYDTYKNDYNTPLTKVTRTLSSIGGPTVGKVGNVLTGLESMANGMSKNAQAKISIAKGAEPTDSTLQLKRFAAGEVPFVGEYVKNKVFAFPKSKYSAEEKAQFAKDELKQSTKATLIRQQRGVITEQEANNEIQGYKDAYEKDVKKLGTVGFVNTAQASTTTSDKIKKDPVTGEYHYFDTNGDYKTVGTEKKAKLAIDKMEFLSSDKNSMKVDGGYLRKSETGDTATFISDNQYSEQLATAKMIQAKKNDNTKVWLNEAEKKYKSLLAQMKDPNVDELDKIKIQNEIDTLDEQYSKYKGYGGFTKPKAAKKAKVLPAALKLSPIPKSKPVKITSKKISYALPKSINLKQITSPKVKIAKPTYSKSVAPSQGKRLA